MLSSALHEAATAFWTATATATATTGAGSGALPELPANPADAVEVLFRARPTETWACAFGPVALADPWPALAVGDDGLAWPDAVWALQCADLAVLGADAEGAVLVMDRCPDPRGEHRAFFVTREGEVRGPAFSTAASVLEWAAALVVDDDPIDDPSEMDREPPPKDLWNRSPASGVGAFALLRELSPSLFYRAWKLGRWFEPPAQAAASKAVTLPRTVLAGALATFGRTRAFALAGFDEASLSAPQRALVERMRDLESAAKADAVPKYVARLATAADAAVASAARAWVAQFAGARAAPKSGRDTAQFRAAYEAVDRCVKGLVAGEQIEVDPASVGDLVEEVLDAMMKASSAERALRAAVNVVLESANVEEVYADDVALLKAFRAALGG